MYSYTFLLLMRAARNKHLHIFYVFNFVIYRNKDSIAIHGDIAHSF